MLTSASFLATSGGALGTILKGGTVVELAPACVERVDLRIQGERIVERGPDLSAQPGDEVVVLSGKWVLPGMVSAHHRLHRSLLRGAVGPPPPSNGYQDHLEQQLWPFEEALDLDAVQVAATAGGLEALQSGCTTLFNLHASPHEVSGSLLRVARGLHEVGIRAVLAYETDERHGPAVRAAGWEESLNFGRKAKGRFRGQLGASALSSLSDEGLAELARLLAAQPELGLHLPLAEDPSEEKHSVQHYGASPVERLLAHGLLSPRVTLAHLGHLSWPDLAQVLSTGAWVVHTPRSNMIQEVGYAPALKLGARATLGTDGLGGDLFAEAQTAYLRSVEAGQPIDVLRFLANGHRMASQHFGLPVGPLREGAAADLLLMDYAPLTPFTELNLAQHLVQGMSSRHVEAVMVDGIWRVWARRPLSVHPDIVADQAREAASSVWSRSSALRAASRRS